MIWDLGIAGLIGWCGTGWPIHFPIGGVKGGGGVDPTDPWPPNCPMCKQIIGAISAIILVAVLGETAVLGQTLKSSGLLGLTTISFLGGSFGANLVGSLLGMARR